MLGARSTGRVIDRALFTGVCREDAAVELPVWLVVSIVASVVLTVLANAILRWRPVSERHVEKGFRDLLGRTEPPLRRSTSEGRQHRPDRRDDGPRVRIIVPWKLMIVVSLALTVVVNLLLALSR